MAGTHFVVTNGSFRNPWKFISQGLNLFSKHTALKVGNDKKILFWKRDTSFTILFPRLFRLTSYPMATIAEVHSTGNNWDFFFDKKRDLY